MRIFLALIISGALVLNNFEFLSAKEIDLSSWIEDTYKNIGGQPPGQWVLSKNNTVVTQIINADPSVYLNNIDQTSYQINGSWQVKTTNDNDMIGFVFGYKNDHQFYLFDWKQETQEDNGLAYEGFRIIKIDAKSRADLDYNDFWSSNTENSKILASNYADNGWTDNTVYDFHLKFSPGKFTIIVYIGETETELWNITINDNSYTSGQFGFYNFSQENVEYSGFEQDDYCPEIKDSDRDGVIDQWDNCPKTPENSCVNNKGCSCELSVIDEKGTVQKGKWKTYYANVDKTYSNFIVKIQNLTDDVDLYVKQGGKPDFDSYDCRPYKGGNRDEICNLSNDGNNLWYFCIYGYNSGDFSISVKAKR